MRECHSAGPVACALEPSGVDGDGDGHVDDIELVDGLHAEVGEGEDAGGLDGLGDRVGRAADGDEVDGLELADGGDGFGPRSALPIMPSRPVLGKHLACELVHAGGGGGAGGADCLVAHRLDRANVVEEAIFEIYRQFFAAVQHVGEALVRGVAAREQLAGEKKDFAGLPGLDVVVRDRSQIDAAGVAGCIGELGPGGQYRVVRQPQAQSRPAGCAGGAWRRSWG